MFHRWFRLVAPVGLAGLAVVLARASLRPGGPDRHHRLREAGPHPTYEQVCTGATGHAEVVQITFDPRVISYRELLQVFFAVHDPTTPNRQGADVGTQYRSIILYHNQEQKQIAEEVITELEAAGVWANPIVTEVVPLQAFYRAEAYHQQYFKRNPQQAYCQVVIAPKLAKLRKAFGEQLKQDRLRGSSAT